jgi:hypothetical protein
LLTPQFSQLAQLLNIKGANQSFKSKKYNNVFTFSTEIGWSKIDPQIFIRYLYSFRKMCKKGLTMELVISIFSDYVKSWNSDYEKQYYTSQFTSIFTPIMHTYKTITLKRFGCYLIPFCGSTIKSKLIAAFDLYQTPKRTLQFDNLVEICLCFLELASHFNKEVEINPLEYALYLSKAIYHHASLNQTEDLPLSAILNFFALKYDISTTEPISKIIVDKSIIYMNFINQVKMSFSLEKLTIKLSVNTLNRI